MPLPIGILRIRKQLPRRLHSTVSTGATLPRVSSNVLSQGLSSLLTAELRLGYSLRSRCWPIQVSAFVRFRERIVALFRGTPQDTQNQSRRHQDYLKALNSGPCAEKCQRHFLSADFSPVALLAAARGVCGVVQGQEAAGRKRRASGRLPN